MSTIHGLALGNFSLASLFYLNNFCSSEFDFFLSFTLSMFNF